MEKGKFTKSTCDDQSGIKTLCTAERRPGLHCRKPWVDPSNAKGKALQKTASKIKIGPFKLKPVDFEDSHLELFSYIFRSNDLSSKEVIIQIENEHRVTRGEFMCLRPEKWINDGVMNAQVYYLQEKGSRNWIKLMIQVMKGKLKRFTIGLKKYEKFQHASERVRVALSLVKNPKNTRLKKVTESARRVVDEELKSCRTWPVHPSSSHRKEVNDTLPGKVESLTVGHNGLQFRN
ncbi:unnamed protein product [Prunus armeniaca]